ncbi:MAG: hypothetical protein AAGJ35_08515, partial [Myxococcota bacterium]
FVLTIPAFFTHDSIFVLTIPAFFTHDSIFALTTPTFSIRDLIFLMVCIENAGHSLKFVSTAKRCT